MFLFGQIINKSMGTVRKRRGAAPCAAQRDGELWGSTFHPCSPCVPSGTAQLAPGHPRESRGTPVRPCPHHHPGLTHPGEGCKAQVNKSVCLQNGLLCAPDNSPL